MDDQWDESVEQLLCRYGDESQVREKLHRSSYYAYKRSATWFQLPMIVFSAVSGTVQLFSKSFPEHENHIITGTATLSLLTSILGSVFSYLQLAEKKTRHETAEMAWQSLHNTIQHCLALSREKRPCPTEFLKEVQGRYEKLFEVSPILDQPQIDRVKKMLHKGNTEFVIPNYMNGFEPTHVAPV